MLTRMNHAQTIKVLRAGTIIASVTGTWWYGRGWYYIRKHPGSMYAKMLAGQLQDAGCSVAEIDGILL